MKLLSGQTVNLHIKTEAGFDPFGAPVCVEDIVAVDNVIIAPTSENDLQNDIQMYGKASTYTLHIPKGDTHDWANTIVEFWGKRWKTFGTVVMYQEELLPLEWNAKVKVDLDE